MQQIWYRRGFLKLALAAFPQQLFRSGSGAAELMPKPQNPTQPVPFDSLFPTQPPELAREMVTVSHFDLKRVRELVEARPSLARSAWDWGFGDWETALGAASHMGNLPIAEYLIFKGAHPTHFSAAMMGHLEVVRAFVTAQPGAQRIRGPHSISLLAHAKAGGNAARPVLDYLKSLGDADADPVTPLPESDVKALQGKYAFGTGATEQIEVTVDRQQLMWTRKGTMGRPLFYLGGRTFYPAGASAVRIRFIQEGPSMCMTIDDPGEIMRVPRSEP
jgi:hypothetical protein